MPRRKLFKTSSYPYHVTARSNNKEWFYAPVEVVWKVFCEKLVLNSELYRTEIHAFMLMSNHFHMILSTPEGNLGDVMRHLLTEVAKELQRSTGRENHIFGSRYTWSLLDSGYALAYVFKYVYRNPVRSRIVQNAEEYPFSTVVLQRTNPPVVEGYSDLWQYIPRNIGERLDWLNFPTRFEVESSIRKALRSGRFRFSKGRDAMRNINELRSAYKVEKEMDFHHDLFGTRSLKKRPECSS